LAVNNRKIIEHTRRIILESIFIINRFIRFYKHIIESDVQKLKNNGDMASMQSAL
jgi:hypothetical protein